MLANQITLQPGLDRVLVVFGTHSGNSQLVADYIKSGIDSLGIPCDCQRAERVKIEEAMGYGMLVLISSTWNVGSLNDNYQVFHNELIKTKMPGKPIAVIGIGDSKHYDIFCGAADIMEKSVMKIGAELVMPTMRIDTPVFEFLPKMELWAKDLADVFKRRYQTVK